MKRFMIAVLAVAVLFGFAACDNSGSGTPSTNPDDLAIIKVVVKDGPSQYFAGEKVDEADYEVVGIQANGEETPLDAAYLTFVADSTQTDYESDGLAITGKDNKSVEAKVIGRIAYNGPYMATINLNDTVSASVYTLNAIGVERTGAVKQYYTSQNVKDIDRADYVVTAYALDDEDNECYKRVLAEDEYTINADAETAFTVSNAYKLTFATKAPLPTSGVNPISTGANESTISVIADKLVSISVAPKTGDEAVEAIDGEAVGDAGDYVDVTYVMQSGEKLVGDEYTGTAATVTWTDSATLTSFTAGQEAKITAKVSDSIKAETSIMPIKNYIAEFSLKVVDASSEKATVADSTLKVKTGSTIQVSDFTVEVTWAGQTKKPETPNADTINKALRMTVGIQDNQTSFDSSDYAAGALPVSFYLTGLDVVNEKTTCKITTVTAADSLA